MKRLRFGLIVTGDVEAACLPKLFRSIAASASCDFIVIRRSDQLSPVTSEKRLIRMVGRGQVIPTIDESQYGLPARRFLEKDSNSFVVVIDDLENSRREQVDQVFSRYRRALDQLLAPKRLVDRASVHFLVNMLEAYYFGDCHAVNTVAGVEILPRDDPNDVENIPHPKKQLKEAWAGFREKVHGSAIVARLDVPHVLRREGHCCWLRTLFYWCVSRIPDELIWDREVLKRLSAGCRIPLTDRQQA